MFAAHNEQRPDRVVDNDVVADQTERMRDAMSDLPGEEYAAVHVLSDPDLARTALVERVRAR